ncbi:MAG: hypothetical protein ACOY3I_08850 [Verrucomicrobiota bacterium]
MHNPRMLTCCCFVFLTTSVSPVQLTNAQALEIGKKLWQNECEGTVDGLTSWNDGENFASLGIGHFIWLPENVEERFEESFPKLIQFLIEQKAPPPSWLRPETDCPWNTKAEFEKEFQSAKMKELRAFLKNTIALQARFAANRLEQALPKMIETLPAEERAHVEKQFYRVAAQPNGFYALMDYVNFKGEGTNVSERYNGQGWGLLQVLQGMNEKNTNALHAFADSASRTLTRRVQNSPPDRGESRWLAGWKNRLQTYR